MNNSLHKARGVAAETALRPRTGGHPADGRNPAGAWKPLDIHRLGADGIFKRLVEFDLGDLEFMRLEALGQERGWKAQREWTEVATAMLDAHRSAKRIEDLSKKQQGELGTLAAEVWS